MVDIKCVLEKIQKVATKTRKGCIVIVGGIVFLFCLLWFGLVVVWSTYHQPQVDAASQESQSVAIGILRECHIGEGKLKKVLHRHTTRLDFRGDGFGAYAIEISDVDVSELIPERGWTRGDRVCGFLEEAVDFAHRSVKSEKVKWLPEMREVKSSDMFVKSLGMCLTTGSVSLVFVRPSDGIVFYVYINT